MGIFIPTPMRVKEFESGFCFDDKYSLDENWLDDLINLGKLEKLKIDSLLSRPIILPHASAFPVQLRVLTLGGTLLPWDCIHLKKIPSSTFVELYSLQLIEFYACPFLLVHSAKEIQQQQQELFEHNWFGVHDYNTQEASIEEKEQVKRGKFEQQEREKLKYRASYPGSSYFAREVQEEEDAKLTDVNFFNCFEDDFDDNDINS